MKRWRTVVILTYNLDTMAIIKVLEFALIYDLPVVLEHKNNPDNKLEPSLGMTNICASNRIVVRYGWISIRNKH